MPVSIDWKCSLTHIHRRGWTHPTVVYREMWEFKYGSAGQQGVDVELARATRVEV